MLQEEVGDCLTGTRNSENMERFILEAYNKANSTDFFAITTILERIVSRWFAHSDPRAAITTGQVRQVLERRGMTYTLGKITQEA